MKAPTSQWTGARTRLLIGSYQSHLRPSNRSVVLTVLPEPRNTELESHLTIIPDAPRLEGVHAGGEEICVVVERIRTLVAECARKRTAHELAHLAFRRDRELALAGAVLEALVNFLYVTTTSPGLNIHSDSRRAQKRRTNDALKLRIARRAQDAHLRRNWYCRALGQYLDHLPHKRGVARRIAVRGLDHGPDKLLELVDGEALRLLGWV